MEKQTQCLTKVLIYPNRYLSKCKSLDHQKWDVTISDETYHASCDIMSEFCLMPKDVYESLSLWKLCEGGEEISLTYNATIFPVGIVKGVYTKVLGRMVSTDYLVIECVEKGQITLGRSLLKLRGAIIDVAI
jgi:hypothetical protein